ncbi:MAG: sigma-70 family RNA polymerase sigma factor [Acidobacteriota bacterium]
MEVDERELTSRARAGDDAAFDALVNKYKKEIYRLAYRFVQNAEDAHDMAQDTFLKAYLSLGEFRGDSSFRTWIYRIAMNLSINHIKSAAVSRRSDVPAEELDPGKSGKILSSIMSSEMTDRLRDAIDDLPPKQRETLLLKVYHDLKYTEIAEIMGCSVGTSKANFFHAVQALRGALT